MPKRRMHVSNSTGSSWRQTVVVLAFAALIAGACSSATTPSSSATTPSPAPARSGVCGNPGRAPTRYRSVVVFAFENRSWSDVGPGFGKGMPYLHSLGEQCSYFTDWTETDTLQNSLSQYVGQMTGAPQPGTRDDCSPSSSCSTRADNLFRQASRAGLTAVNYVEGASSPCSAAGNASKHVPALYMWGSDDRARCNAQVRPLTELHPNALPAFAFVTPNLCHDGHDCANGTVDQWASAHIQLILSSAAYRQGRVAVFVWYDEDHPVPNLWISRTAAPGPIAMRGAGYAGTLKAWEAMLGLRCLALACSAPDMRARANT